VGYCDKIKEKEKDGKIEKNDIDDFVKVVLYVHANQPPAYKT
jgi:hypothetical protein